jgi:catechol 2,3-dioxygenase-like lactoylglutathione lyase family enzyme
MSWNLPGEARFGIHSIDHFALEVPSLEEARDFFTAFGLRVHRAGATDHLELRAGVGEHVWARIFRGPRRRLAYLSLNCFSEELDGVAAQVVQAGCARAPGGRYADATGIWLHDDSGNLVQVKAGPRLTARGPVQQLRMPRFAGARGAAGRTLQHAVRPRRLSHVLMFTPDLDRSLAFYRDVLGLRLSDRSGAAVAFLHARHGCDHHLVAFAASHAKGWHHSSWEVADVEEVGRGGEQMRAAGHAQGWGTGRHVLGSNYFHYVRDPWGSFAEYSADIDYVPAGQVWPAGDYPPEDSLYLWGPPPPAFFVENHEG